MRSIFLVAILSIYQGAYANYSYEYEQDVVQLKCDGQIDKFLVNITSFINPKDMKVLSTKIDFSYKVQVWSSPEPEFSIVKKASGGYVGIEASVEGDSAKYKMTVPKWSDYSWTENSSSFKTALTLKAGLINGNLDVDCQASLQKGKFKTEISN